MIAAVSIVQQSVLHDVVNKYSSLHKILRIIAYCLRFARSGKVKRRENFIEPSEIASALQALIRTVQRESLAEEYLLLSKGESIRASSRVASLTPFIDKEGMIRVGGRLGNAMIPYESRHPLLLPKSHRLTQLIIEEEHVRSMHAGLQATMCAVRQRFWPIAMRSTTRKIIRDCVTCFKCKPVMSRALMSGLPGARVTVSRPFTHTGVDYAGPISLKENKRRNAKLHKAYICVFVCFATKAVHLEIVNDLTAEAFLGAFKRFISRRGKPTCMYSDNGTTFVGASKKINEMCEFLNDERLQNAIRKLLCDHGISWRFIPPYAPHFGGLWEAAVKSAKFHMHRIVGSANLTLAESQTLLCEIEAIMNSRPLTPISADPNDLSCITPGHFLIGAALNSFPVPDMTEERESYLTRWQRVEQIRQHFWRRWSGEYLHTLIERQKWRFAEGKQLAVGQLALIQQPGMGPLQWQLGRIEQVHPGADGVSRTATLRTSRGVVTRPLTKLAILPLGDDERPPSLQNKNPECQAERHA